MDVTVVCVGTSHPGNVGAIARGAANFGVTDLRFVAPRCDIRSNDALARAVHAHESLQNARVVDTLEEAISDVSLTVGTTARTTTADKRYLRKTLDVRDWVDSVQHLDGKIALVFGREDTGLTAEEVNQLDQLVTVPTADYNSLNLAHAVSLLCYETWRIRAANITAERTLEPGTLHRMNKAWDDIIESTERREWRREVAQSIWRKIIGRSQPSDYEVHNIMGILGNVLKRFDHPDWATPGSKALVERQGLRALRVDEEE